MIICADDFGMADDINAAILDLARQGRIHAVSCMVNLHEAKPSAFDELAGLGLPLGLHWNLTVGTPLAGAPIQPISAWALQAAARRLPATLLHRELAAQYERFRAWTGRAPEHLDSHQHTHQFPVLRDVIIRFALSLPEPERPAIRNTGLPPRQLIRRRIAPFKTLALAVPGWMLKHKLLRAGLRTNSDFAGIYDYRRWRRYEHYFPRFLRDPFPSSPLMMVHPGTVEPWRANEYRQLQRRETG